MKLSIVIPYYNAEPYTSELLDVLAPQIREDVEVILVDDGSTKPFKTSHKWCRVIRKKNGGVATARNSGIKEAKGTYISFIDADDLVAGNYVKSILKAAESEPDVIEFSWKSLTDKMWKCNQKLWTPKDRLTNPSVCTRCFRRSFIGKNRFNEKKDSTEDEDFSRKIGIFRDKSIKFGIITDYLYFYRDEVPESKTKRYAAGLMNTKRVVYYYPHVTRDMKWLLEEIKKEDEVNEVFLLTEWNDINELERYCQILKPQPFWGHIIRGEKYSKLTQKNPPFRTQVVIYRRIIPGIGGLLTFILNFIEMMADKYDITILCENMDSKRVMEISKKVRVMIRPQEPIACDTLIVLSFLDKLPQNVYAKKTVRMCHACKTDPRWKIPQDYDELLYASRTAMESFGVQKGEVLHNLIANKAEDMLLLISATRLPAPDKGDIENRMKKLAKILSDAKIPFLWFNFADGELKDPPGGFYNMGIVPNMQSVFRAFRNSKCYCVALSDSECWSYTVLESLTEGIPLICTPFPSVFEMGIKEGENAHIVPFDMEFDVKTLLDVPVFTYTYDNTRIMKKWTDILGKSKPKHDYVPPEERYVRIRVKQPYNDRELKKHLEKGQEYVFTYQRALDVLAVDNGLIEIVGEG